MINKQDMKKALDVLNMQLILNYSQIAEKFGVERTTLICQHKSICTSMIEATSLHRKLLTNM